MCAGFRIEAVWWTILSIDVCSPFTVTRPLHGESEFSVAKAYLSWRRRAQASSRSASFLAKQKRRRFSP
jgi:hypothetical protein